MPDYALSSSGVPTGAILLWHGTIATIPEGYALCDGNSGTPNLTNKFIMGAGGTYNPADTGGSATKTLSINEMPSHTHIASFAGSGATQAPPYAVIPTYTGTASFNVTTSSSGSGNSFSILNPYYALAYIMKL